jgi:hypothetical protein
MPEVHVHYDVTSVEVDTPSVCADIDTVAEHESLRRNRNETEDEALMSSRHIAGFVITLLPAYMTLMQALAQSDTTTVTDALVREVNP